MDLLINLSPNGGDLFRNGRDLATTESFETMVVLALWGGNVAQSTPVTRPANTQAFDWWGNSLLMSGQPQQQFNSLTERTMHQVPLTSAGRLLIQQAIEKDLEFMQPFAVVTVQTAIIATDVLQIDIRIRRPDDLRDQQYIFIWDAIAGQITNGTTLPALPQTENLLQYYLNHQL